MTLPPGSNSVTQALGSESARVMTRWFRLGAYPFALTWIPKMEPGVAGTLLRHSPHQGTATYSAILAIAEGAMGEDADGYRNEFLQLVTKAQPKQSR